MALSADDTGALLLGVWVRVDSSNVYEAHYDADSETLTLGFDPVKPGKGRSGSPSYYEYPGITFQQAQLFALAPSHGQWAWDNLIRPKRPFAKAIRADG